MKICYFIGDITTTGGIERVLSILTTEQLKDSEFDITIVSQFHSHLTPNYFFDNNVKIVYLSEKKFDGAPGSLTRFIHHFEMIGKVRKFFMRNRFDLILSQSFPNTFTLWIAGLNMSRVIGVEHVFYGYYNSVIRRIRHVVYKQLAQLVVLTNNDKSAFRAEGLSNIVTIANPVVLSNRSCSPLINKKIISVGRLVYQKGFDTLIEIFGNIHLKYPDWVVEVYGSGVLLDELQSQVDKAELTNCFKFMGVTDRIECEYHKASIFAMPSRFEGFPMVLVEAMSQGLACVSFDCPSGPSDIICNENVGMLIENQKKADFEKGLSRLIENTELRQQIGRNAFESVERFDVRNIVCEWKDLFQKILG